VALGPQDLAWIRSEGDEVKDTLGLFALGRRGEGSWEEGEWEEGKRGGGDWEGEGEGSWEGGGG